MNKFKMLGLVLMLCVVATLVVACGGEGDETNAPAVKLTASTVVSQPDLTAHTHAVSIPFTDISAAPADAVYQYRSDTAASDGHSHVIALTQQQMIDIDNGMRVVMTSSAPDLGPDHSHDWSLQGGDLLYEKYCYNCHSNDKRGHNPMNVSFNAAQTGAVKNPASAPLSTAPAAIPDPNYLPSGTVSLDGVALYAANCQGCHNPLATTTKANRTFSQIKNAITANAGGMSSLAALTDAQLQAIADALVP
ncbi:MAG TPA: cytochrome c [Geothermobacteraceae bacterium]|nr:cytochrome c [Geothermobacteraceae bacterium]